MSVLILSLFNGILLFRQRTEQSVLYHVCPDAEGLGGTLNSALLKVGLAKGDALSPPCCFPGDTVRIPKPVPSFELHSVFGFRR